MIGGTYTPREDELLSEVWN